MDGPCFYADDPSCLTSHLYTVLYRVAPVAARSRPQSTSPSFLSFPELGHELMGAIFAGRGLESDEPRKASSLRGEWEDCP